jgi:ABC-type arginine transport system permease subunit
MGDGALSLVVRWWELPISRPIRRTLIFFVVNFRKINECILILVIYWKKTGLLRTTISNHNIIYSS